MSRWAENFQNHTFQQSWATLKSHLEEATIDDKTLSTSVSELARLNQVVTFIDEMLNEIEPNLTPLEMWNQFKSQTDDCDKQVVTYNGNRNIDHIKNANSHADNLLTYIRPYMMAKPERKGDAKQKAILNYAKTIDGHINNFRENFQTMIDKIKEYRGASETLYNDIEQSKDSIDKIKIELFGNEGNSGINADISKLVDDFEKKHQEIKSYYNEVLIGNEKNLSFKKMLSQSEDEIIKNQKKIAQILEDVNAHKLDLNEFYTKIFGEKKEGGVIEGGLRQELEVQQRRLDEFETKQKGKYDTLFQEIKSLLPDATGSGLASAYNAMKTSFEKPIFGWNLLFYFCILLFFIVSFINSTESITRNGIVFIKLDDWDIVLKKFNL